MSRIAPSPVARNPRRREPGPRRALGRTRLPRRALSAAAWRGVQRRRGVPHRDLRRQARGAGVPFRAGEDLPRRRSRRCMGCWRFWTSSAAGRSPTAIPFVTGPAAASRSLAMPGASDAAIAGARRVHGDRRRLLSRCGNRGRRRRFRGGISTLPGIAAHPHRAGDTRIPLDLGVLPSPRASPARYATAPPPIGTRRTCSAAWRGSMTARRVPRQPPAEARERGEPASLVAPIEPAPKGPIFAGTLDVSPFVDSIAGPANHRNRLNQPLGPWPSMSPF